MCRKKNKIKAPKIKKQQPLAGVGALSIFSGILGFLVSAALFVFYFFINDPFIDKISNMNEALLALFFIFIVAVVIVWGFIKLIVGSISLAGLWVPAIFNMVAGNLIRSASANINNVYSNKSARVKTIWSLCLWIISIIINSVGIYFVLSVKNNDGITDAFIKIACCAIGVAIFISLLCFVIVLIDYCKKIKLVKRDANNKIIDETYISSSVLSNDSQKQAIVEKNISGTNQFNNREDEYNSNSGEGKEWLGGEEFGASSTEEEKLKVGDITPQGKVIGFNVNTGEPIFMPNNREF